MSQGFDSSFVAGSKAYEFLFESIRQALGARRDWPTSEVLSRWAAQTRSQTASEHSPRFVDWDPRLVEAPLRYERQVAKMLVPTRERSWHDLLNALVWMHFPESKRVLNAIQLDETEPRDPRNGRSDRQNAAALFDECGAVVWSDTPQLLAHIRGLRWRELFWERRGDLQQHFRLIVIGHGLLDLLRAPYLGLTAKVLVLACDSDLLRLSAGQFLRTTDCELALRLQESRLSPACLLPFPVLGMPGWYPDQNPEFYENARYFRRQRQPTAKTG